MFPVQVNVKIKGGEAHSTGHAVLGVFELTDLTPDDIFGFRIEVVKQERGFEAGNTRNLIFECIDCVMARFRNRRCLLLSPQDIRLGLVTWDGIGLFRGFQVIIKGEKGLQ